MPKSNQSADVAAIPVRASFDVPQTAPDTAQDEVGSPPINHKVTDRRAGIDRERTSTHLDGSASTSTGRRSTTTALRDYGRAGATIAPTGAEDCCLEAKAAS